MKRPKSWKPGKLYQLGDRLPYNHPAKKQQGSIFPSIDFAMTPSNGKHVKAFWSGHYRAPKKGEWYLSGCEGFERAYLAPNDLTGDEFFIMRIALVENKTTTTTTVLTEY